MIIHHSSDYSIVIVDLFALHALICSYNISYSLQRICWSATRITLVSFDRAKKRMKRERSLDGNYGNLGNLLISRMRTPFWPLLHQRCRQEVTLLYVL